MYGLEYILRFVVRLTVLLEEMLKLLHHAGPISANLLIITFYFIKMVFPLIWMLDNNIYRKLRLV